MNIWGELIGHPANQKAFIPNALALFVSELWGKEFSTESNDALRGLHAILKNSLKVLGF